MKMTFHFFPKSGVLRKTSLTLLVVKDELRNSRILVVCDVTNYKNISFFMLCRIVANNHNLANFFCWSFALSQNEIFQNSIRNASYSAPIFIEWFIVKDLDIRNVKYWGSHLKFYFFHQNKENDISRGNNDNNWWKYINKMLSVLNTIIHKKSHSCAKMRFYAYFLQK